MSPALLPEYLYGPGVPGFGKEFKTPKETFYILAADKLAPIGPYCENSKTYVASDIATATTKAQTLAKENPGYAYIVVKAIVRAQLQPASVELKYL